MSVATLELTQFRANPATGKSSRVDRKAGEAGVIYGAVITRVGDMRGHGIRFDRRTLGQIAALAAVAPGGAKARFGHPPLLSDGIGSYIGRWRNVRPDAGGDVLRGDLWLSVMSRKTPQGDLGGYVLDLAENEPDAFGVSPVVKHARDSEAGHSVPVARVSALFGIDVVDDPASGAAFFSSGNVVRLLRGVDPAVIAKFKAEYAAGRAIHAKLGVSELSYLKSRCREDGIV